MITLEAYRAAIGCFNPKVRLRTSFIKRCYKTYFNDIIQGSRLFPYSIVLLRFIKAIRCSFLFMMIILLLMSGDVESNPGPVNIIKVVQANFNQSDPRFGESAGSVVKYMDYCACANLFA